MSNTKANYWYKILFDEGENVYGKAELAFAPHPLKPLADQFFYINPFKNTRGVCKNNEVSAYRNILIEFDFISSVEKQIKYVEKLEMPYTMATFSGGKSVHFIISLKESLPDEDAYKKLVQLVYAACDGEADSSCRNAARLSRTPWVMRGDTGNKQDLLKLERERVTLSELETWLYLNANVRDKVFAELARQEWLATRRTMILEGDGPSELPMLYKKMKETGMLHPETNSRHQSMVKAAVWAKNNNWSIDNIEQLLYDLSIAYGIEGRGDVEGILNWLKSQ